MIFVLSAKINKVEPDGKTEMYLALQLYICNLNDKLWKSH